MNCRRCRWRADTQAIVKTNKIWRRLIFIAAARRPTSHIASNLVSQPVGRLAQARVHAFGPTAAATTATRLVARRFIRPSLFGKPAASQRVANARRLARSRAILQPSGSDLATKWPRQAGEVGAKPRRHCLMYRAANRAPDQPPRRTNWRRNKWRPAHAEAVGASRAAVV